MTNEKNYLSEFEQEWNSDGETADVHNNEFELDNEEDEFEITASNDSETDNEWENDNELENDNEFETDNEWEDDHKWESSDEREFEPDGGANRRYEQKLYSVLNDDHESELEFEQQLNEVLHEMEKDYFWGSLKKRWNKFKRGGLFKTLKGLANKSPFGDVLKQVTSLARGDIKGMLKGLAGQALAAAVPGGGVAKQLLNLETPINNANPKKSAQIINSTAKAAYANLINGMGTIASANQLQKIKTMGRSAFNQAWQQQQSDSRHIKVRRITLHRGQKLVVRVL